MTKNRGRKSELRPDKIIEFIDAAYDFDSDDQTWVTRVMESVRSVWKRGVGLHGGIYDASDAHTLRMLNIHVDGFPPGGREWILKGREWISPRMIAEFRTRLISMNEIPLPEMKPMIEGLAALGFLDTFYLNGIDPEGHGVIVGVWSRDAGAPPAAEMAVFSKMAHHLGAAYRCRRRLRAIQPDRSAIDPTEGAAAILDARRRVVHATGLAQTKQAQKQLIETSRARDQARTSRPEVTERLPRWRPLTDARWTLIDSFERGGARYVVARENPCHVHGLAALTHREQQVVAYAAIRQSTKETAYALGISDTTVRVLIARAAAKLGVKTRAELLEHPEVRPLRPDAGNDPSGRDA